MADAAIIHGRPKDNPQADPLRLLIQPGSASADEIAELLSKISELSMLMGGSSIVWKVPDAQPSQEKIERFRLGQFFKAVGEKDFPEITAMAAENPWLLNRQDEFGKTALHTTRNALVVEALLKLGADPNIQDKDGMSPLHLASIGGPFDLLFLLVKAIENVNIPDENGCTPLHHAMAFLSPQHVGLLLDNGADPHIKNNNGRTPLDYGRDEPNSKTTRFLFGWIMEKEKSSPTVVRLGEEIEGDQKK